MSDPSKEITIAQLPRPSFQVWARLTPFMPWVVLAISLIVTLQLWQSAREEAERKLRSDFQTRVDDASRRIVQRMLDYEQVLAGVRGLFAASSSVERGEFRAFIEALKIERNFPGVQSVGWVPMITAAEKPAHIAAMQREGFPQYSINPPGERELYAVGFI